MGYVRKLTGADQAKANAQAQIKAIEQSAKDQTAQLMEQARMAAETKSLADQRLAAQQALEDTTGTLSVGSPDVTLGSTESTAAAAKRRAAFKFSPPDTGGLSL